MEIFELKSLTEFYQWKEQVERETCSSYVQQRGLVRRPNGDFLMYFDCNRSGEYTPHGKGLRNIKTNSSKVGSKCASNIRIKVTDSGQRVIVKYSKNHDKHPPQVEYLRLPKKVKSSIADQLKGGVPISQIMNAIQDVSSYSTTNHRFPIKRKDILNIKRDFNIKNESVKNNFDKTSLKTWAKKLSKKGYVNPALQFVEESDNKDASESLAEDTPMACSSSIVPTVVQQEEPSLPTANLVESNASPIAKASAFIQIYQQIACNVGQNDSNKIHDLLNTLLTICSQVNNTSKICTYPCEMEQLLNEKDEEQEKPPVMFKKDSLIMNNYYKPLTSEEIGISGPEELFELEEVFEESKFYEDMVKGDILGLNNNLLDEVLNVHTEFDHNYL